METPVEDLQANDESLDNNETRLLDSEELKLVSGAGGTRGGGGGDAA